MEVSIVSKLDESEYLAYQASYLSLVKSESILENLHSSRNLFLDLCLLIPEDKRLYRYAPEKWTVQDVILHLIDTERIFQYRALCFSRDDKNDFPGFEENSYALSANANIRSFESLVNEFKVVRESSILLFENMEDEKLPVKGNLFGNSISVRAWGYLLSGHLLHHMHILKERYL